MKCIEVDLSKLAQDIYMYGSSEFINEKLDLFFYSLFEDLEKAVTIYDKKEFFAVIYKSEVFRIADQDLEKYVIHTNKIRERLELKDPDQLEQREIKIKELQDKALTSHREFALEIVEFIKENAKQHYRFRLKEITEHSEIETDLKGHIIKAQTVFIYPLLIVEG